MLHAPPWKLMTNKNIRLMSQVCSNSTIKVPKKHTIRHSTVFIHNYENILHKSGGLYIYFDHVISCYIVDTINRFHTAYEWHDVIENNQIFAIILKLIKAHLLKRFIYTFRQWMNNIRLKFCHKNTPVHSFFQTLDTCFSCGLILLWVSIRISYNDDAASLNLSRWRSISYRNQSIDLLSKSMDWCLYDRDLVNLILQ